MGEINSTSTGRLLLWRTGLTGLEDSPFDLEQQTFIQRMSRLGCVAAITSVHEALGFTYHGISTYAAGNIDIERPLHQRAEELGVQLAGVNYRYMRPREVTDIRIGIHAGYEASLDGIRSDFKVEDTNNLYLKIHADTLYIPEGAGKIALPAAMSQLFGSLEARPQV